MKVFFDEDNGQSLPRALLLLRAPCEAITYPRKEGPVTRGTPDTSWLAWVGENGYLAVSQNRRILDVPDERAALERHAAGCIFLASGQWKAHEVARLLLNRWDWFRLVDVNEPRPFAYLLFAGGGVRKVL